MSNSSNKMTVKYTGKHRSAEALSACLRKSVFFHDKREERGGAKNDQANLLAEYDELYGDY